ncbi:beta strand repeat-containing protein, partial [Flavobacterium magnesitis]|uniref:beta strand repeat-containing protein n=1 Tax=Flavobacterium magnesitis TaxID=3138077 RepID=UPI00358F159D
MTDPMVGLVISGSPIATLAPGATNTNVTGTYVITQADVDAGKVTNSALVTSKDPQNNDITDISGTTLTTDDATETPVNQTNTIALVKTGSVVGTGGLGETITYTFAVTNTGTTTLTNIVVTDPMIGLTITGNPIATLAPGATNISIKGTYSITQDDVDAGNVTNSALVTAQDPQNNNVTDISGTTLTTDDNTETPVGQRSTIALVKTASVGGTGVLGDTITYTFAVTNTGTTTLTDIVVTDPLVGLTITGSPIASLAPGDTDTSITGTYVITQTDIDAGKVVNSALVTAKDPLNNDVTDISGTTIGTDDSTETPVTQTSSIALVKTAVAGTRVLGDTITYTFEVINTGTTTLENIVVSDPLVGLTVTGNPITSLAPGATNNTSITGTYAITQADIDAGKVTNSALVIAKDPQNNNVTDVSGTTLTTNDATETPVTQTPTIALVKTAVYNGDATRAAVGDTVTYTFTVTNTGNVTVNNIVINDAKLGVTNLALVPASLAPSATGVVTQEYTITQADIDAGVVTNTAIAIGQDPQGVDVQDTSGTAVDNDDSTETTLPKSGSLAFVKTGVYNGDATRAVVGDIITYTFTVTNTGNVTVDNIVINDAKLGVTNLALVPSSLAPSATGVVTQDYIITQADIDAGVVTNTAITIGQDPQGVDVQDISGTAVDNDDSTETNVPKTGSLAFVKTGVYNGDPIEAVVGDIIAYTFTVTNTGNVAVNNIVINDTKLGVTNLALVPSSLAPSATGVVTQNYVVTQADVDAGIVVNTAIAIGQDPEGINVQDISGTAVDNDDSTETALPNPARQQCNAEIPTPFVSANFDDLSVSTSTFTSGIGVCLGCNISNEANLINANENDYATASFGALNVGFNHSLRVTDGNSTYAAGTFAGFKIAPSGGLLSLDLLSGVTIRTYNDGDLRETFSGASLLSLGLLSSPTDYIVGFNTAQTFDAVEIVLNGGVTLLSSTNIYHAVIRQYCAGPALDCNTVTKLSLPTYPVAISHANTGMSGVSVGSVSDVENAISSSDSDYASINLTVGLLASGSIAIKDQVTDHPAGTYAGFEIENTNLLSVAALGNVVVSTYLNGSLQEEFSGSNLVANVGLLSSGGRFKLGFVSTQDFDEVKLSVNQTVGLNLGTTRVYGAVFQKFCAGPALACNVQTVISAPTYPVYINSVNSGIDGVACVGCTIVNQDNLIDADLNSFAEVNLAVGIGTRASLSVKEQITDYPAGTFAGYTIENPALLTVGALDAVRVTTYLNGVEQETKTGNGALVSVGTDLLVGTGRNTVGFVSTLAFDEVQITFENVASVNLGQVKVYNAVFQRLCDPIVECNENYVWSNPAFPVTINNDNTGIDGVACVACAVNNTNNLLTADQTDFANITVIAGVLGSGSVAVKDHLFTYPQGTFAGYLIRDLGTLAQVNLLQSLTISTYNNGVLQEARSAGQLIDLSLLGIDILGSTPGLYNVGFKTSLPFDEIKLTLSSLASVINSIDVYGAFVNTSESDGGPGSGLECNSSSISLTKDGIYVDANSDGIVNVGDRIDYTFNITNTGFETLTNVTLTDDTATVSGTPIASLTAGSNDTTSYTATYNITQADIDAGVVYNLATVSATTNIGTNITATSTDPTPCTTCPVNPTCADCTATPLSQDPKLAFVKTGVYNGDATRAVVGDIITYTFTVTNTGNVTVDNIVINDAKLGVTNLALVPSTLAPLATGVVTQDYAITQADIDAGVVTNTAIAIGQDPQGVDVQDTSGTAVDNDDSTETTLPKSGSLAFVKTG